MKYIKYAILIFVLVFSFFVSDKMLLWVENLSPIMEEIENVKAKMEVKSVNAEVSDNTIIPGLNGKKVNERESYVKMNEFGAFNESFLVYDYVKPEVSLYDNLDKIIIKGRDETKIAILLDSEKHASFFEENKIYYDLLTSSDKKDDKKYAEKIDLNMKNKNKICIVGKADLKKCKAKKYFLVMPNLELNKDTLYKTNNIEGGTVLYIKSDVNKSTLSVIINKIKSKNLAIIKISDLIKE